MSNPDKRRVHVAEIKKTHKGKVHVSTYLRRTFRQDGKVKHETVANISDLPDDLLKATEKDLDKIVAATQRTRKPLRGEDAIGLAVGQVIGDHKMKKHFELTITENSFSYARRQDNITAEAALDGLYVIRTCVTSERMESEQVVLTYKSLPKVERAFRGLKSTADLYLIGRSSSA